MSNSFAPSLVMENEDGHTAFELLELMLPKVEKLGLLLDHLLALLPAEELSRLEASLDLLALRVARAVHARPAREAA